MMDKNILFLTNLHLWSLDKGKGGRAFFTTVSGYKKAGWNIWLVTTGGGVPPDLIDQENVYERLFPNLEQLRHSKVKIKSVFARYMKMFKSSQFQYEAANSIIKANHQKRFIIYAYEVGAVRAAKRLSLVTGFPLVTRFQGTIHSDTTNSFFNRIKKMPHLSAMGTNADITIMTNDGTKGLSALKRFGNNSKKTHFLRNGVERIQEDLIHQRQTFRDNFGFSDQFIFLTVSRLVAWKKVERAIRAFALLSLELRSTSKLVIIGDGDERMNLQQLAKQLNVEGDTLFIGAIDQLDVRKYMIAADVFLSLYDLSNVGNPLMEAMMCGKAIITLNNGDTCELIKDSNNGILLDTTDERAISASMSELITNPEYSANLAEGARRTALEEFWSWDERIAFEVSEVEALLNQQSILDKDDK